MILVSCKGSISLLRAWQCWGTSAEHSPSSCRPCRVTRAGQAPPEAFPELSVAHSNSKSEGSLPASCRSTPGRRISHGKSCFCYYLPSSASFCLEVLSALLPVNKSTFPKGAFSHDSPFHSARDTLRSNSFLLDDPIFYLHFLHDRFNDNALFPLSFLPFLFPLWKVYPGLISFPVAFKADYFLPFIFI